MLYRQDPGRRVVASTQQLTFTTAASTTSRPTDQASCLDAASSEPEPGVQRVRLGILATLTGLARGDFAHLKREFAVTDCNLGRHLEVLGDAGFVKLTRDTAQTRPRTWVSITAKGKKALRRELDALRKIMSQVEDAEAGTGSGEPYAEARGVG